MRDKSFQRLTLEGDVMFPSFLRIQVVKPLTVSPDRSKMKRTTKVSQGLTLVEVMVSILIMAIVAVGASGYRYYTTIDVIKAEKHITGARIALLLCESWKGIRGSDTYDPLVTFQADLSIAGSAEGPSVPVGLISLNSYRITSEDTNYYTTLAWKDVSPGFRELNVAIQWDQRMNGSGVFSEVDKNYSLTTYVTY